MATARIFNNGRSQAVRLPKEYRFTGPEVGIARMGDIVILYPANEGWNMLEKSVGHFTDDFMSKRNQPKRADRRGKF